MRKSTIAYLIIGALSLTVGVVGVVATHENANYDLSKETTDSLPYNQEELIIDGSQYGYIRIRSTDKKEIQLETNSNVLTEDPMPTMDLKGNTLTLNKKEVSTKDVPDFLRELPFFNASYSNATLEIPKSVTHLTLKNVDGDIRGFRLKNLLVDGSNTQLEGHFNDIRSDIITLQGKTKNYFSETQGNELNIYNNDGSVYLDDSTFKDIALKAENTDLDFSQTKVGNFKGTLNYSDMILTDFTGNVDVSSDNLKVGLAGKNTGNFTFDIESGYIYQEESDQPLQNTRIETTTDLGKSAINNEETHEFGKKEDQYQWKFKIDRGDVVINSPDYDEGFYTVFYGDYR